ncbi:hypothetical protein H4217_003300 [Coemansia sp. RSA 1939]|nr:hypothetical protein H4217_003300 [Coemansia sp. RSA 1939]KAJ2617052.1 hypothetical protein EV177_000757 [Coemansia sp. RSA 1804]
MDTVIHTSNSGTTFDELSKRPLPYTDKNLNIKFDSKEAYNVAMHTLQFNCPIRKCNYVDSEGWKGLKSHVRGEHAKSFCDLCLKNKKSFAEEHKLFTKAQLRVHYSRGDSVGFTGHPQCEFCDTSFYDNDQLFDHCRKRHEQCFICVRNGAGRQVYYPNYDALEEHYDSAHFLCKDTTCLQKKFVVFENDIDLQGHQLSEHGGSHASQRARREAKQVNLNFQYTTARGDGSTSNGSSRDRQRNANRRPRTMTVNEPDTAGVSIAGRRRPAGFGRVSNSPMDRPAATRARNPTLSDSASAPSTPEPEQEPELESLWPTLGSISEAAQQDNRFSTVNPDSARPQAPAGFGRLSGSSGLSAESPITAANVNEETMSLHQDLLQRVSAYLSHREQPVSRFRKLTTQYKDNQISASDYVNNCWLLFLTVPEKNAKEMIQKTVKTVANLLPNPELKDKLMKALSDHRIKQQQFPALTPLNNNWVQDGTSESRARILVIKSPSSRAGTGASSSQAEDATEKDKDDWPAPSSSRNTALKHRPSAQLAQRLSNVSSPLSATRSADFPSLGASPAPSPSLGSMMSQASISPRPANSLNSYGSKFSVGTHRAVSSPSGATTTFNSQRGSEFPDLPPPSTTRPKIPPLNPNARSAWSGSGPQQDGSSNKNGSDNKQRNSKGKQVLFRRG